ncbi:MAG: hypothetical protein WCQ21_33950, partial [Verrucomicrobiota bacterium]
RLKARRSARVPTTRECARRQAVRKELLEGLREVGYTHRRPPGVAANVELRGAGFTTGARRFSIAAGCLSMPNRRSQQRRGAAMIRDQIVDYDDS